MAHVSRGDTVVVTKGREIGKQGKVKRVLKNGRVEIENINMLKRHVKPSQKNPQGGIQEIEGSIALPNVALWCGTCGAGRRYRNVVDADSRKRRVCVKCDSTFEKTKA